MPKLGTHKTKSERLLDRSNKPILVLAALAVGLYILELFRVVPQSLITPLLWINFIIDFIFLIDLLAKCLILGRGYLRSPWFLIDFVSTLPLISSFLELIGGLGPQLQATRVARAARITRIARVARLARVARVARLVTAIRAQQGLTFLKSAPEHQETPNFNKALFIGVPLLLAAFIFASSNITNGEVAKLSDHLNHRISQVQTQADLDAIINEYDISKALNPGTEITTFPSPLHPEQQIALSLSEAYTRADRLTGILLLVVLLTIALTVLISSSLAKDRSLGQERSLLSQCFSPPIVNKFYNSPDVIDRFYNQWMTVFFIDIRGFTKAAEKNTDDVEGLALKLRKVMDTARTEIVVTHEGVIDKFMGDAVMGWVGGHFSAHWDLLSEVRSKLCLDELDKVDQDIKSIQRELKKLKSQENDSGNDQQIADLEAILQESQRKKSTLKVQQVHANEKDPNLRSTYQMKVQEYRRRVARTAVNCCLKITREVRKIEDPDGFQELKIGIGSGPVLVGNFGSTDQIGFTVLGPTVNRSARLEPASAQCGCNILIDQNTYDLVKDFDQFRFRRVPRISVSGISQDIVTYEPFFTSEISESFLSVFEQGVAAMEGGNTDEAINYFTQADELKPGGDAAAQLWLSECQNALQKGEEVGVKFVKK